MELLTTGGCILRWGWLRASEHIPGVRAGDAALGDCTASDLDIVSAEDVANLTLDSLRSFVVVCRAEMLLHDWFASKAC